MLLDPQTGVSVYQFVVDRLEDRRREQYPEGSEAYSADWAAAHALEKDFAEAIHSDDRPTAHQLLQQLLDMAAPWRDHPHHPSNDGRDGHPADPAAPGTPP
ncbi:hypothetical protein [Streptomyces clavuligerus]|uniref:hypothetical protein n=1 Tax=Streptomyces clavuligerus TaxID=1901 RepID=UPI00018009EA|nr:hypothetical protein [Streptomyces clavuligerus]EDY52704.1 hypothetical protein SSCG_05732 [Streptomyces clavuligerus]WDN55887.1 hypothetical protein LL058_28735 [Streptomyces clavuligerus]